MPNCRCMWVVLCITARCAYLSQEGLCESSSVLSSFKSLRQQISGRMRSQKMPSMMLVQSTLIAALLGAATSARTCC